MDGPDLVGSLIKPTFAPKPGFVSSLVSGGASISVFCCSVTSIASSGLLSAEEVSAVSFSSFDSPISVAVSVESSRAGCSSSGSLPSFSDSFCSSLRDSSMTSSFSSSGAWMTLIAGSSVGGCFSTAGTAVSSASGSAFSTFSCSSFACSLSASGFASERSGVGDSAPLLPPPSSLIRYSAVILSMELEGTLALAIPSFLAWAMTSLFGKPSLLAMSYIRTGINFMIKATPRGRNF